MIKRSLQKTLFQDKNFNTNKKIAPGGRVPVGTNDNRRIPMPVFSSPQNSLKATNLFLDLIL